MGFHPKFYPGSESLPTESFTVKSGEAAVIGQMMKITSGEAEPADSGDTTMFGVALNDAAAAGTVELTIPGTVYEITDANIRLCGAALDLNGTSDGVTTKSNDDLVVWRNSTATEDTLVQLHDNANLYKTAT